MDTYYLRYFLDPITEKRFREETKGVDAKAWARCVLREFVEVGYVRQTQKGVWQITKLGKSAYQSYLGLTRQ